MSKAVQKSTDAVSSGAERDSYDTTVFWDVNMSPFQKDWLHRSRLEVDDISWVVSVPLQPLFPKKSYLEVLNREEISWISTTCRRLCVFSQLQRDFPWDFTILAAGRGQCATLSTAEVP